MNRRCKIRQRQQTRSRGGYTLMEMIMVVFLLGCVAGVASELFIATSAISTSAAKAQTQAARLDGMIRRLRFDAWHAEAIAIPDQTTAVLRLASGQNVTWQITADGTISREVSPTSAGAQGESNQWPGLNLPLRFALFPGGGGGDALIVSLAGEEPQNGQPAILVSQIELARKEPR